MCTVTFLPQSHNGFILTSNRDEDILRPTALLIQKYFINGLNVYYPRDPKAGGTWIASGSNGFTICLFNGAFKSHIPLGNYKKSRGLVVLDFFNFNTPLQFIAEYNFNGIEPFSIVFVNHQTNNIELSELKWDGEKTYYILHNSSIPHIWSSATLYSPEVILQRETWFNEWVKVNEPFAKDSILLFHHFGGSGNKENDLVMNRNQKQTVSISCINKINNNELEIVYEDVINKKIYTEKINSI